MRRSVFLPFMAFLIVNIIFFVACGDDHHNNQNNFDVQTSTPANGATCVDDFALIQITFNAAASSTTVNTTTIQITDPSSNFVSGTVTYDDSTHMATFTPTAALSSNVVYTITVSGVTSSSGGTMKTSFSSIFTTGPCADGQPQYSVSLVSVTNMSQTNGTVSVDSKGVVTTQLTGATASTTYTLQFCPAPGQNYTCFSVGEVATDGTGAATKDMTFPKSGAWAGDFQLMLGGTEQFTTQVASGIPSPVFAAQLEPSKTTNGNGVGPTGTQDPLTSGTITISGTTLTVTLNGAPPNSSYGATECPLFSGSSCFALSDPTGTKTSFATDGNGNATFQVMQDGSAGDIFFIDAPSGRAGFVGGFKIP